MSDVLKGASMIAFGALEGYAFSRVGMLNPQAMEDQMLFNGFMIMKLFLSAVGCSMLFQAVMSIISPKEFEASRFYRMYQPGFARAVGGCAILGVGMALSGSGPTILPSQIGAGVHSGFATFAGMLAGGALFAMLEPYVFGKNVCPLAKPNEKNTLDTRFGGTYASWAVPMGLALLGGVYGLETMWPHSIDTQRIGAGSWLPVVAGAVIGFNQIPLRYLTGDGQGGSTSVMNMLATVSGGRISARHRVRDFVGSAQFLYVYLGTTAGAFIGATQVGLPAVAGFAFGRSFAGGALMILGARTALGCTCGHGISGFSELSINSIFAACAIFGAGIATTFGLKAIGMTNA